MLSCYVLTLAFIGFVSTATQVEPQKPFRTNCQEIERVLGVMNGIDENEIVKSLPIIKELKQEIEDLPTKIEELQARAQANFDTKVSTLEEKFGKDEEATRLRLNSGNELPEGKKICVTEIRSSLHGLKNAYPMTDCYSEEKRVKALEKITTLESTLQANHARIVEYRKQLEKGCNVCCNDGDVVAEIETFLRRGPNVNDELRTIESIVNFGAIEKCTEGNQRRTDVQVEHRRLFHVCCLA